MGYIVPNEATHALVSTIEFSDGGEDEQGVICFGSFESCDQTARMLPAISYSGGRPTKGASISVVPLLPFCERCGQRHDEGGCCPSVPR